MAQIITVALIIFVVFIILSGVFTVKQQTSAVTSDLVAITVFEIQVYKSKFLLLIVLLDA